MRVHHLLAIGLDVGLYCCFPSAEGRQDAPAADAKPVSFWDHRSEVYELAFAPDGKTMETTTGRPGETIALCDLPSMTRKRELTGISAVSDLIFSPDSRLLAVSAEIPGKEDTDPRIKALIVWDVTTGKKRYTFPLAKDPYLVQLAFG